MPIDATETIQAVQRSLGQIPASVFVILLLTGPTLIWLLYRSVVHPRTSRDAGIAPGRAPGDGSDLLWMCNRCRSANEARSSRCYRCGLDRDSIEGDLQIIDGGGLVTLSSADPTGAVVAIEDDRPQRAPVPVMAPAVAGRPPEPARATPKPPRRIVAVGPGRPIPAGPPASPPATTGHPKAASVQGRGTMSAAVATSAAVASVDEAADPSGEAGITGT